jgi:hypothetical protein
MSRFYPHDIEKAQREYRERWERARQVAAVHTSDWYKEFVLLELEHVAEHGLPSCYKSIDGYLYDFWPNLPWNESRAQVIQSILADARFASAKERIRHDWSHDMEDELRHGLNS